MGERIQVEANTYDTLKRLKREDEMLDDLVRRLVKGRRERVRAGAGLREGTDASAGARTARSELNRGLANETDVE